MISDNNPVSTDSPTRKYSTSNRFEIEKVEETQLNSSYSKNLDNMNENLDDKSNKAQKSSNHPSALKKTVTHYLHDDDFFDLDSANNTVQEKTRFLKAQDSKEKDQLTDSKKDDDEVKPGCFEVNYNEKNEPTAIICNLSSSGVKSYSNCVHELKTIALYQKLIAEYLGTCILTLYACSIGLPIAEENVPSINGCLGGGLTLATLIWCLGNVSGGHLNPAVTIAFLFTGKINPLLTIMYVASQLLGAFTGAVILQSLAPERGGNISVTDIHSDINIVQAFGVETIITFILVFTIFSCVDSRRKDLTGSFPLQIGFAVVVGGLFGGRFTGGSMNPARSFGPALATGIWRNHWIYWAGPISGAIIAGFIYQFVLTLKCPRKTPSLSRSASNA